MTEKILKKNKKTMDGGKVSRKTVRNAIIHFYREAISAACCGGISSTACVS